VVGVRRMSPFITSTLIPSIRRIDVLPPDRRRHFRLATTLPFFAVGVDAASSPRVTVAGDVPTWANVASFRGAANNADTVAFRVYLNWPQRAEVEALAQAVSDPKNAAYGHLLTALAFRQVYAPSQASVDQIQAWLRAQGFTVGYTPLNNHHVSAIGTPAQAATAFSTSFGIYSVHGKNLRSPSSDISVPDSIAPLVQGVIGLDESDQLVHPNVAREPNAPPSPAFVSASPCSSYWGQLKATRFTDPYGSATLPYTVCGYTPQQIRSAYGIYGITGDDGSDQTVVIIDAYASPTIQRDLDQWSANRRLPSTKIVQDVPPGLYFVPETPTQDPQGWYGEETLDVEAVHGMAPAATIVYVGARNPAGVLDIALNNTVDAHLGSIVTNSYGYNTEDLPRVQIHVEEDIILQGVAEGIGISFSSGDNGDESTATGRPTTVDWPASSPYVTAVGGTSLAVGASNNYLFETAWGTAKSTWTSGSWSPTPPGT
jgi:subtilase family serine protease